jgi:hypothetical protein
MTTTDEQRAAMLKGVHGALLDAGLSLGDIGDCEATAVRELARQRDDAESAARQMQDRLQRVIDRNPIVALLNEYAANVSTGPLSCSRCGERAESVLHQPTCARGDACWAPEDHHNFTPSPPLV